MLPEVAAAVMLVALIAYALLGGADFGGGVWDLFASGPRAGAQRETIARAIGPIWEANHVWLILVVVLLFSAFPPAFALIMTALHIPVAVMLIGIVLRGSSFVFRTYDARESRVQRRWGRIFAISSVLTPIFLGVVIGAITMDGLVLENGVPVAGWFRTWLHPFPFAVGIFALAQFAFLAAVYLTLETDDEALREDFRRRALLTAVALGAAAGGVLLLAGAVAPGVRQRFLGGWWSCPLQAPTGVAAVAAIAALWLRRFRAARIAAGAQVALILLGWGMMMNPWLVAGSLTLRDAASPDVTLRIILGALAAGSLLLFPAFYYLYRTFKGGLIFAGPRADGGS
jgi:cytochrome bd ubiquinol oxidase subunit II